jgi:hypothetical protein
MVFQSMANYSHRLQVFRNLELYCEYYWCYFQLIQIIWCPTSLFIFITNFKNYFTLEHNCWAFCCSVFTWHKIFLKLLLYVLSPKCTFFVFWWPNCFLWWYHYCTCIIQIICKKRSLDITSPKNCICVILSLDQ